MIRRILNLCWSFVLFFSLIAFVVTCNFFLFLHSMQLDEVAIRQAAPVTFFNIILLSLLFCIMDEIHRIQIVTKPVKRIREGMAKIIAGDFKVRIPYIQGENSSNDFDAIINGMNEMAAELSSVETLRTDFVSNVSHELKTPLSVIQNYGTMLQSSSLPETQRIEYAKAITEQTRKLSNLISNILKLNRLENQQISPEKKPYDLTEQICECLLVFEHAWEKKELEIVTDLQEDVTICQDAELLSLVWNN